MWICFAVIPIVHLRKGAGEFERPLPGLGAAVAKKCAVQSGDVGQHLRQFRLILVEKKIRNMNQASSLTFNRRLDRGMAVAKRIDTDSAQEIQIPLALRIPEIHAAPANK